MKKMISRIVALLLTTSLCSCAQTQEKSFDRTVVISNVDYETEQGIPIGALTDKEEYETTITDSLTETITENNTLTTISSDTDASFIYYSDSSDSIAESTSHTTVINQPDLNSKDIRSISFTLDDIPPSTSDEPFIVINNNVPFFDLNDYSSEPFEYYSPLDDLGRCGECVAYIGQELMPTAKRGSIGMVKPSGWQLIRYDGIVDGNYLFNRCHLIGYQLTGENANISNLITGTRYMNTMGMLPFENETANYIHTTGNHVLYRVTPYFEGDNLLVTGVLMEAKSVEDNGTGLMFNVFCYNIQPQIYINYVTGENYLIESEPIEHDYITIDIGNNSDLDVASDTVNRTIIDVNSESEPSCNYIVNTNTKKFHYTYCSSVSDMKEKNKLEYTGQRDELIEQGYTPCGRCKP